MNDYFTFLEKYMGDYYTSQYIADINDLERALDEEKLDNDTRSYMRKELHRLTLAAFEQALSNYLNIKYPIES